MKISKKIIAVALSVLMILSVMPFTAFATEWSGYVWGGDIQAGDILTSDVEYVMDLDEYTLTLQAGSYGTQWEEVINSDLILTRYDIRNMEAYDGTKSLVVLDRNEYEDYYPYNANGMTNRWVVVAVDHNKRTITLAGASAPLITYNATFGESLISDSSVERIELNSERFGDVDNVQANTAYEFKANGNVEFSVIQKTRNYNPNGLTVTMGGNTVPVVSSWIDNYSACVFYYSLVDTNGDIYGYRYYMRKSDVSGDISIRYTPTPAGSYADLKNTAALVHFNDIDWYLIADNSTSLTEGSVTLLAKECFSSGSDQWCIAYANSDIKASLDAMTQSGGSFEDVADAILSVDLTDVNVTGAKLYLPTATELTSVSPRLLKSAQATGAQLNWWWLRSRAANGNWQAIDGTNGSFIDMPSANQTFGVRPALKLDLSKVEFDADTNTFALPSANNGYNLTLNDGINVNFLIDTDFYGAEDGYIEYEYIKSSTTESAEREGGSIDVADLPTYSGGNVYDGDSQLTLKAAPAQIAEDYIIRVYDKDGELKNTLTVSIADYCEKMKNDATYGELMSALLDYGQLANEYFGYADKVEGDYEVPHSENYKAELSAAEAATLNSLAAASIVNQGTAQVSGVSYIVQMKPEFKFYFTGTSAETAEVSGGLNTTVERTSNGSVVKVTGLNASDFDSTFTVTVDGTTVEYNGYAYIKAALGSAALKDLAQGIFRYAQAADKTFN